MDVLVVSSDKNSSLTDRLEASLADRGIPQATWKASEDWQLDQAQGLFAALRAHSHTIFVSDERDLEHPGFLLAAGYCQHRGARTLAWVTGSQTSVAFISEIGPIAKDLDELVLLLMAERDRWSAEQEREHARAQLVERGFEVTNSAFWETVEKGDTGSVELFLKAGFLADSANKKGVTMLCLSVRFSHFAVLRLLLSRGADINRKSLDRDNTPLMDAAAEGHVEMVQELVALGADLAGQSRNGQNALVLAIGKGSDAVAKVLIRAGADPFADDKLGMNALKYAQLFGRKEVLELVAELHPGRP